MSERDDLAAHIAACLALPADVVPRFGDGELRFVRGEELLARVIPRRGRVHVDAVRAPRTLPDRGDLVALLSRHVGRSIWDPPFDRGPGLYRLDEIDRSGVATRAFGDVDARVLYLDTECLGDCTFCRHAERLSDGAAEALLVETLRDADVDGAYVCIGGPEPTQHPLLERLVQTLRDGGARERAMIATADALGDPAWARRLADAGLGRVSLPIYAADPAAHDAIVRRSGAFSRLERAIAGARDAGIQVHLHTLLLSTNADALDAMLAWATARGLSLVAGLPRPKGDRADVAWAPTRVPVVGGPLCVFPEVDAPLDAYGPIAIYLAVQAGEFAPVCATCALRARCWGAPHGIAKLVTNLVRPR